MTITFNNKKQTYIAVDKRGLVLGIYNPAEHGTVEEFRNAMAALVS